MNVERTRIGTIGCVAACRVCDEMWDDYKKSAAQAKAHAKKTGHAVWVERTQSWAYKPDAK